MKPFSFSVSLGLTLAIGCSSGNFDVANTTSGPDTGKVSSDTGTVSPPIDTGGGGGSEDIGPGGTSDGSPGVAEAGSVEASVALDAGPPPCTKTVPVLTCPGASYESHHDIGAPGPYLPTPVSHSTRHFISFVVQKSGRIEKLGVRMRRNDLGTGEAGTFTVSAYLMPCPESLVPIGKHTKPAGDVPADTTFYFTPESTGGAVPYLQYVPKGTRIAFVIETNSTRHTWDLRRAPMPVPNTLEFQAATRTGDAPWAPGVDGMVSTLSYIRTCDASS